MAERPAPARPPRQRVDLRRALSRRMQVALAMAVIAVVAPLAWWLGRDDPVPAWMVDVLIPLLGWAWLALAGAALTTALIGRLRRRRRHAASVGATNAEKSSP